MDAKRDLETIKRFVRAFTGWEMGQAGKPRCLGPLEKPDGTYYHYVFNWYIVCNICAQDFTGVELSGYYYDPKGDKITVLAYCTLDEFNQILASLRPP